MRSAERGCFSRWRALGSSFSRPLRQLPTDPKEAQCRGLIARRAALERYIPPRFLHDWGLQEAAEVAVRVS
jgi:hypothetical protein